MSLPGIGRVIYCTLPKAPTYEVFVNICYLSFLCLLVQLECPFKMHLGNVEIIQYPTFDKSETIEAHTASCYCIDFDPKGRYVVPTLTPLLASFNISLSLATGPLVVPIQLLHYGMLKNQYV